MADIELSIGASDGEVLKSLNSIIAKIKQMEEATKKAGAASREAERDGVSMGDKIMSSLTGMAARWLSVAGAISLAKTGVAAYFTELNRAADVTMTLAQRAAGLSGQLGMSTSAIQDWLKTPKAAAYGMTMGQQAGTLEAVTKAAPMASTAMKLQMAETAMGGYAAGEKPEELGAAIGGLYEVTGGRRGPGELLDLVMKMRDLTGGRLSPDDARQLMSIGLSKGMSVERILGLATAGTRAGFDIRATREILEATDPGGAVSTRGMSEMGKRAYGAIGPEAVSGFEAEYKGAGGTFAAAAARAGASREFQQTRLVQEIQAEHEADEFGRGIDRKSVV